MFQRLSRPGFSISTSSVPGMRVCSGQRPLGLRLLAQQVDRVGEPLVGDCGRQPQIVETTQHGVVPMPWVGELREPLRDDLACVVGSVQTMRDHELERTRFGVPEGALRNDASGGCEPKVLEHVERRVKRAVTRFRVVPRAAVPAAVGQLRAQHSFAESRKPPIRFEKVGAEPEPEAEMAEIDALQQERTVHVGSDRHEPTEQALDRATPGWMAFRQAEGDEQQRRPGSVRPTSLRPLAVRSPGVE